MAFVVGRQNYRVREDYPYASHNGLPIDSAESLVDTIEDLRNINANLRQQLEVLASTPASVPAPVPAPAPREVIRQVDNPDLLYQIELLRAQLSLSQTQNRVEPRQLARLRERVQELEQQLADRNAGTQSAETQGILQALRDQVAECNRELQGVLDERRRDLATITALELERDNLRLQVNRSQQFSSVSLGGDGEGSTEEGSPSLGGGGSEELPFSFAGGGDGDGADRLLNQMQELAQAQLELANLRERARNYRTAVGDVQLAQERRVQREIQLEAANAAVRQAEAWVEEAQRQLDELAGDASVTGIREGMMARSNLRRAQEARNRAQEGQSAIDDAVMIAAADVAEAENNVRLYASNVSYDNQIAAVERDIQRLSTTIRNAVPSLSYEN